MRQGAARTKQRHGRAWIGGLLAGALMVTGALASAPMAAAKSPHRVDPALMQPPLNPNFAPWTCFEAGSGITCQGSMDPTYSEPAGLQCDGQEVYINGYGHEQMTRWHNSDGLALKTIVHLSYPADVFSLSPTGTGPTVTFKSSWNRHYVYPVPGDLSARVLTEVGKIYMARAGHQVVFHDVGKVTFAPGQDFEVVADMHGVHDYYSDPSRIDQVICESLT